MKYFICEICGESTEGNAAPCGAECCDECCAACYDKDGFCEAIDREKDAVS